MEKNFSHLNTSCPSRDPFGIWHAGCIGDNFSMGFFIAKSLAVVIIIFLTILGNLLVLFAVVISRNLRSSTHYLIVNLAVADLLLGTTVLPFSAIGEITDKWYFGQTFCTIWTSSDVLCCTASILSLCVISLDRYIGVTRPLAYSTIMVGRRTSILIVLIWAVSVAISIGPLLGWREPPSEDPYDCAINKQLGYVLFSSTGSFYLPMFIILFVYWKIYKAALRQTKFLECGIKTTKQDVTLRVHLGGLNNGNGTPEYHGGTMTPNRHQNHCRTPTEGEMKVLLNPGNLSAALRKNMLAPLALPDPSSTSSVGEGCGFNNGPHEGVLRAHRGGGRKNTVNNIANGDNSICSACQMVGREMKESECEVEMSRRLLRIRPHQNQHNGGIEENHHVPNSNSPSPPSSSPERNRLSQGFGNGKIAKFRRQKKAAKTLAIVVGVFLLCWFPFFFILPLESLCEPCKVPDGFFRLFFWLGYFNSCLNPFIYASTSREFQRAFRRILCRRRPPRPHISRTIYRSANVIPRPLERHVDDPVLLRNAMPLQPINHWA